MDSLLVTLPETANGNPAPQPPYYITAMAPSPPVISLCHRCPTSRVAPFKLAPLLRRSIPVSFASPYSALIGRRYATTVSNLPGAAEEDTSTGEFQKEFKKAMKARNKEKHQHQKDGNEATDGKNSKWLITAGLEIHAQLNTKRKLFSDARTSHMAPANTHISLFDASLPGTQPKFNPAVLLPALRASIALHCTPAQESRFDRKHYFYWDQPAGYQITQFYAPLAANGHILLFEYDGVDPEEHERDECVRVDIQQIQLEQDTGKTIVSPPNSLIDLNRVGSPLIEIITNPFDCPNAVFPALVMKKIQASLKAVDACTLGMEWGGLRADVNVSVRLRDGPEEYGQRCEIKNISSLKSVQEAVDAEARRQIGILEAGGVIEGETRGWDAEKGVTRRLRGKEGEVDYRFMPDPDLPPVFISEELIAEVKQGCPALLDKIIKNLTSSPLNLKTKDAKTLILWDESRASAIDNGVVWYYRDVVRRVSELLLQDGYEKPQLKINNSNVQKRKLLKVYMKKLQWLEEPGTLVGNWIIHELGGQLTTRNLPWKNNSISPNRMASLIAHVIGKRITGSTGKNLLSHLLDKPSDERTVTEIVKQEGLEMIPTTDDEIRIIAEKVISQQDQSTVDILAKLRDPAVGEKFLQGKINRLRNWFVGRVMSELRGKTEPKRVKGIVDKVIDGEPSGSGEETREKV